MSLRLYRASFNNPRLDDRVVSMSFVYAKGS